MKRQMSQFPHWGALLFCFIGISVSIKFVPESRIIDTFEGASYMLSWNEDGKTTNVTKCFYISETINGSFDVKKYFGQSTPSPVVNTRADDKNQITNSGKSGWCTMYVNNVADNSPKTWTFIAEDTIDSSHSKNYTANIQINIYYNAVIARKHVVVYETSTVDQYLITRDLSLKECYGYFNDVKITFDLNSKNVEFVLEPNKDIGDLKTRLRSLGNQICGFKLINAKKSDIGTWSLTAVDTNEKSYKADFKIDVFAKVLPHIQQYIELDSFAFIDCSDNKWKGDQDFCSVYNPAGELVFSRHNNIECREGSGYQIENVKVSDLGVWKYIAGVDKSMEMFECTVELILKSDTTVESVVPWVSELKDYFSIGCYIKDGQSYINNCQMTAPNKQIFNVRTGLATERYSAIGTNFSNATCALQIQKPLQPFEIGRWKCELNRGSSLTGTFIDLESFTPPTDYPKLTQKTARLGKQLSIACNVPYSSSNCFIIAPNGTRYDPKPKQRYESRLGRCSIDIEETATTDRGTWTCYFSQETGTPDEEIQVEVSVGEILKSYRSVDAEAGSDVELMCSTGGFAINYCRFMSPSAQGYQIADGQHSKTISYYGVGFKNGECGIKITNVQSAHDGIWTCFTHLNNKYDSDSNLISKIQLNVASNPLGMSTAASAGIGIGAVILVIAGFGFLAFKKWRNNRLWHSEIIATPIPHRNSVSSSGSSNNDAPLFNVTASRVSYRSQDPTQIQFAGQLRLRSNPQ